MKKFNQTPARKYPTTQHLLNKSQCDHRLAILKEAYDDALKSYPIYLPRPRAADIFALPRIHTILAETPPHIQITKEMLNITETTLPAIMGDVKAVINSKLLSLVRQGLRNASYDEATVLELATTVFRGPSSSERGMTASEATSCTVSSSRNKDEQANNLFDLLSVLNGDIWNTSGSITFDCTGHNAACRLLKLCEVDPTTTTISEMNELDPIIECIGCNKLRSGRLVMTWSRAIKHALNCRHANNPSNFVLIRGTEAQKARLGIKASLEKGPYLRYKYRNAPPARSVCMHCGHQEDMPGAMRLHLQDIHSGSLSAEFRLWPSRARDSRNMGCDWEDFKEEEEEEEEEYDDSEDDDENESEEEEQESESEGDEYSDE
ncbi:hypothetical protein CVT24_001571 [Panaeolus cyanescens]|uniref:Uncharacterized protein n=1 Tax=Panaeolus cyanescens TaxID=181874 RepID=A0A409YFI2_9AGAR|nr:hypothetical protein CVT24_001571 [Panaeolus cyanescens]